MVLGIDEYLGKKRRNKDIKFIAFKKYYQKICKQTGCEYKKWVEIYDVLRRKIFLENDKYIDASRYNVEYEKILEN